MINDYQSSGTRHHGSVKKLLDRLIKASGNEIQDVPNDIIDLINETGLSNGDLARVTGIRAYLLAAMRKSGKASKLCIEQLRETLMLHNGTIKAQIRYALCSGRPSGWANLERIHAAAEMLSRYRYLFNVPKTQRNDYVGEIKGLTLVLSDALSRVQNVLERIHNQAPEFDDLIFYGAPLPAKPKDPNETDTDNSEELQKVQSDDCAFSRTLFTEVKR